MHSLLIGPLLSVTIYKIVDFVRLEDWTRPEDIFEPEARIAHYDEVHDEPTDSLDGARRGVHPVDHFEGDEPVALCVARRAIHDAAFGRVVREHNPRHHISSEIDEQNGDRAKWQREAKEEPQEKSHKLRHIRRQNVRDRLFQVVEERAALFDSRNDCGEVVV